MLLHLWANYYFISLFDTIWDMITTSACCNKANETNCASAKSKMQNVINKRCQTKPISHEESLVRKRRSKSVSCNSKVMFLQTSKQVSSDNDATEVGILGHLVTFQTFWDIMGQFRSLERLDRFLGHFRPFSSIISSLKRKRYGRMDGRTDGQTLL